MSFRSNAMGTGTGPAQASALIGGVASALTATGSTQTDALALAASNNEVTTTAASTGVILPSFAQPGDWCTVYNYGASTLSVYPPVGGSIAAGATNAAFSVATNKSARFALISATRWGSILSA